MFLEVLLEVTLLKIHRSSKRDTKNNIFSFFKKKPKDAFIRDVERSDEGQYMCQINTARAKTRLGNLHVVGEWIRKISRFCVVSSI